MVRQPTGDEPSAAAPSARTSTSTRSPRGDASAVSLLAAHAEAVPTESKRKRKWIHPAAPGGADESFDVRVDSKPSQKGASVEPAIPLADRLSLAELSLLTPPLRQLSPLVTLASRRFLLLTPPL